MLARRSDRVSTSGFTLVEVLVVVVIIVALAAIAVPIFLNQKDKADEAATLSDVTAAGKMLMTAASTSGTVSLADGGSRFLYASPDGSETADIASKGIFTLYNVPGGKVATGSCVELVYEGATMSYTVPTGVGNGCQP